MVSRGDTACLVWWKIGQKSIFNKAISYTFKYKAKCDRKTISLKLDLFSFTQNKPRRHSEIGQLRRLMAIWYVFLILKSNSYSIKNIQMFCVRFFSYLVSQFSQHLPGRAGTSQTISHTKRFLLVIRGQSFILSFTFVTLNWNKYFWFTLSRDEDTKCTHVEL